MNIIRFLLTLLLTYLSLIDLTYGFAVGYVPGTVRTIPTSAGSIGIEKVHQNIVGEAFANYSYQYNNNGDTVKVDSKVLQQIKDADADTDLDQSPHLHFDDESFTSSIDYLEKRHNALIKLLSLQKMPSAKGARFLVGTIFHTIQDFYSHTNWIYLDQPTGQARAVENNHPQVWKKSSADATKFLSSNYYAAHACEQNPLSLFLNTPILNPAPIPSIQYTGMHGESWSSVLTSGYAWGMVNLVIGTAPVNKCAHGFFETGIHKDWSGRDGHDNAKNHAVQATIEYLDDLVQSEGVKPDNVCMLLTGEYCPKKLTIHNPNNGKVNYSIQSKAGNDFCPANSDCIEEFNVSEDDPVIFSAVRTDGQAPLYLFWSAVDANIVNCESPSKSDCNIKFYQNPADLTVKFSFDLKVVVLNPDVVVTYDITPINGGWSPCSNNVSPCLIAFAPDYSSVNLLAFDNNSGTAKNVDWSLTWLADGGGCGTSSSSCLVYNMSPPVMPSVSINSNNGCSESDRQQVIAELLGVWDCLDCVEKQGSYASFEFKSSELILTTHIRYLDNGGYYDSNVVVPSYTWELLELSKDSLGGCWHGHVSTNIPGYFTRFDLLFDANGKKMLSGSMWYNLYKK